MSTLWTSRGDAGGDLARRRHRGAESTLEEARAALARLEQTLRQQREEVQRLRRSIEELDRKRTTLDEDRRRLDRIVADSERQAAEERSHIARLEHDAEQALEARFRGRSKNPQ